MNTPTIDEVITMAQALADRLSAELDDELITPTDILDAMATEGITLKLDRGDKSSRAYIELLERYRTGRPTR